jgi:hypothetical protein
MDDKEWSYLAIDPGETTGWAAFDESGTIVAIGQFKQAEQNDWLDANIKPTLKAVITEDYTNHPGKQRNWTRNQTSKNIGSIETVCHLRRVPIFLQRNTCKSIGYKYMGMEPPSNHSISHQYDAAAHGTYWLRIKGILRPTIPKAVEE